MRRIGIDVGGTNTDAVLMDGDRILSSIKTSTTADVFSGIRNALNHVLAGMDPSEQDKIHAVMIGTTHFTNAVVERRGLARVASVRIGLPAATTILPMQGWPRDLHARIHGESYLIRGGHEFDGRPIVPFDSDAMRKAAEAIAASGVTAVAITSVFSPITADCETEAEAILKEVVPEASVTLSSQLGRIGLLERENATILNSALHPLARETISAFKRAIGESGLKAPLFLTQNDGTVMQAEQAAHYPVRCFASGPTNSMRGARMLSGIDDAVVLDIGGTTTDAGFLQNGFPREANSKVDIGGVATFFPMPDVVAVALGGGTVIREEGARIGPDSVGFRMTEKALVFGGDTLTLSDFAIRQGLMQFGEPDRVENLEATTLERVSAWIGETLGDLVDQMKTSAGDVPVIVVGGGAALAPDQLDGVSQVIKVENAGVANAVGAAMAQVSGEVDKVYYDMSRDQALEAARLLAEDRAIEAGADARTLKLIDVEDAPLSYMPGNPLRVRVRLVGDLGLV
ncbi:hydantoinase/oxoprolinase family protein [uncultured Cohaesibacter sp.]|uniref:hydantoinase/oxoprolinase family protein n=1 Tax=uncultured Cohaesibacter sp. TaxID=1002546 RepID=UPI0029C7A473|nr:hydantoinase/oxoprolinase family protein [uncultured Cohaesibacter sp.]